MFWVYRRFRFYPLNGVHPCGYPAVVNTLQAHKNFCTAQHIAACMRWATKCRVGVADFKIVRSLLQLRPREVGVCEPWNMNAQGVSAA